MQQGAWSIEHAGDPAERERQSREARGHGAEKGKKKTLGEGLNMRIITISAFRKSGSEQPI